VTQFFLPLKRREWGWGGRRRRRRRRREVWILVEFD
jgi:hypothetical protein